MPSRQRQKHSFALQWRPQVTKPDIDIAGLRAVLDHAEEHEAPAPGIAWGKHILNFADVRALLAIAERAEKLEAALVEARLSFATAAEETDNQILAQWLQLKAVRCADALSQDKSA